MGRGAKPAYVVLLTTLRCNAARSYSFREHKAFVPGNMKLDRQQQIFGAKCEVTSQEHCLSTNVFTENKEDDMFKSLDIQEHMEVVGSEVRWNRRS